MANRRGFLDTRKLCPYCWQISMWKPPKLGVPCKRIECQEDEKRINAALRKLRKKAKKGKLFAA